MKKIAINLTLLSSLIIGFSSAQAATCFGPSCEYKDPATTGCSKDAVIADTAKVEDTYNRVVIQLRWSPSCKTNWTRIYYENKTTTWDSNLDDKLKPKLKTVGITRKTDSLSLSNPVDAAKGIYWTKMVYGLNRSTQGWGYATMYYLGGQYGTTPTPYEVSLRTKWK